MSSYTPNLQLFKYNTSTDGKEVFSIEQALNHNWDILDQNSGSRNIGEIVASTIPLTDAGLHLLDGSLLQYGSYKAFIDYIANIYNNSTPVDVPITLPKFISNIQDGITISDSRNNTTVLQAIFNGSNTYNQIGLWNTYWINIDYNDLTLIHSYTLQADNSGSPEYPSAWTLEATNDGNTWVTLDTQTGVTFSLNELKTFDVSVSTRYKQYRLVFSSGVESSSNGELKKVSFSVSKEVIPCFTTEVQWEQSVLNYGVCGKFVYDSINNTVRLPKYSDKIYTTSIEQHNGLVKGTGIALGFTDGGGNYGLAPTGNTENTWQYRSGNYGLSIGTNIGRNNGSTPGDANSLGITLDASKSGMEVELTDITSPLEGYYYIVVANSAKTNIQVDIDEIATDLNNKLDRDLTNVSNIGASFKSEVIDWWIPDYDSVINLGSSITSYTAPSDGYLYFNLDSYSSNVIVNGNSVYVSGNDSGNEGCVMLIVKAGDVINIPGHQACCFIPRERS